MVNKLIAILLLILLNIPLFSKWSFVVYYQVNKSYIAKELCINRNKPQLHCDGKCFLAKKLKAAEEKEQKATSEKLEKMPEITLFWSDNTVDFLGNSSIEELPPLHSFSYIEPHYSSPFLGFFQPPKV
ncbi:hypothetical protein [Flectobacillus major]|uniref:hypothetical protein n=1 Tax=Flectobacillus major TaxID=103 RepID=UPI00041CAFB3|nr:hypothetical protein [Flectobacillus major]